MLWEVIIIKGSKNKIVYLRRLLAGTVAVDGSFATRFLPLVAALASILCLRRGAVKKKKRRKLAFKTFRKRHQE